MSLSLYDAKTQLSALVDRAAAGEDHHHEIRTAAGQPGRADEDRPRRPGRAKGKIWIAANFDAPLPKRVRDAFARPSE